MKETFRLNVTELGSILAKHFGFARCNMRYVMTGPPVRRHNAGVGRILTIEFELEDIYGSLGVESDRCRPGIIIDEG